MANNYITLGEAMQDEIRDLIHETLGLDKAQEILRLTARAEMPQMTAGFESQLAAQVVRAIQPTLEDMVRHTVRQSLQGFIKTLGDVFSVSTMSEYPTTPQNAVTEPLEANPVEKIELTYEELVGEERKPEPQPQTKVIRESAKPTSLLMKPEPQKPNLGIAMNVEGGLPDDVDPHELIGLTLAMGKSGYTPPADIQVFDTNQYKPKEGWQPQSKSNKKAVEVHVKTSFEDDPLEFKCEDIHNCDIKIRRAFNTKKPKYIEVVFRSPQFNARLVDKIEKLGLKYNRKKYLCEGFYTEEIWQKLKDMIGVDETEQEELANLEAEITAHMEAQEAKLSAVEAYRQHRGLTQMDEEAELLVVFLRDDKKGAIVSLEQLVKGTEGVIDWGVNPSQKLNKLMQRQPGIKRAMRGFYNYDLSVEAVMV